MNVIVSQVNEDKGAKIEYTFREGEPQLKGKDCRTTGPTNIRVRVTRRDSEVRFRGAVSARVELDCARCLTPAPLAIDDSFDLLYIPLSGLGSVKEERELGDDDLLVSYYQGDEISLDDLVREQIELAIPMTGLCAEECKGLCPGCGSNLNIDQCSCPADEIDPRWGELGQWK